MKVDSGSKRETRLSGDSRSNRKDSPDRSTGPREPRRTERNEREASASAQGPSRKAPPPPKDRFVSDEPVKQRPAQLRHALSQSSFAAEQPGTRKVLDLGAQGPTAPAGGTNLSTLAAGAPPPLNGPGQILSQAVDAYKAANDRIHYLEERCARELASMGPGLTGEQKQRYIAEFQKEHTAEYKAAADAAKALSESFQSNAAQVSATPAGVKLLTDTFKELAETPHGLDAAKTLVDILENPARANPSTPEQQQLAQLADGLEKQLREELQKSPEDNCLSRLTTPAILEQMKQGQSPEAAITEVTGTLTRLVKATGDTKVLTDVVAAGENLKEFSKHPTAATLSEMASYASPVTKGMTYAAVALGAVQGADQLWNQQYSEALKTFISTAPDGARVFGEMLEGAASQLARGSQLSRGMGAAGSFLQKGVGPFLGVISSAMALADHVAQARNQPIAWIAAFGDVVSFVGACAEFVPGLQIPGAAAQAVGAMISLAGSALADYVESGTMRQEKAALLDRMGIPPSDPLHGALLNGDPARAAELEKLGIPPEDVQRLARWAPELLSKQMGTLRLPDISAQVPLTEGLHRLGDRLCLAPSAMVGLLEAAVGYNLPSTGGPEEHNQMLSKLLEFSLNAHYSDMREYKAAVADYLLRHPGEQPFTSVSEYLKQF